MTIVVLEIGVVSLVDCELCGGLVVPRDLVWHVLNIIARPLPAILVFQRARGVGQVGELLLKVLERKHNRLHAGFVERVSLGQVEDVELYFGCFFRLVDNLEVKPLRVPPCVQIVFEPQVVLYVVDLACFP